MRNLKDDFARIRDKIEHRDKNVAYEFQRYGFEIAEKLNDTAHTALYIKLAKEVPRDILERVLQFVLDYPNPRSLGKLFMHKLKELTANGHD